MFSSWRIFSIIVARLLVLISIRVSAALVASITKASPEDGALDASGAFLTWGSAIFTRLYSEGAVMTMTAFGCIHHTSSWNDKLKKYINRYETSPTLQSNWYDEGSLPGVPPMSHAAQNVGLDYEDNEDDEDDSSERLYLFKRIFGGRWERKLLLVIAVAYFIEEIAVLVLNVLSLVGSFESNNAIFFTPDDEPGQCAIGPDDLRGT